MGLGFRYARRAGGRWNRPQKSVYLSGRDHYIQIADWEGGCEVTTVKEVAEFPWQMSEYGTEWLSQAYWWIMRVVSIAQTKFSSPQPFRDPDNSASRASSIYSNSSTNPGDHDASATTLVSVRNTRVFRTALTPLTEPRTLGRRITRYASPRRQVTLHTYLLYFLLTYTHIRTTRVLHASQLCWSRLHNAWQCFCLSPAAASLGMLLVSLEIIATTYRSMIFKTYAFSSYSDLCIYATDLHTVYLDWQHTVIVSTSRCAWWWRSSKRPPPWPLYLRTPAVAHLRCTWRPWSSELRDALGGHNPRVWI